MKAPLPQVPGIPCEGEAPVFGAPWQAQAFAMTLALYERGLFTWPEWAQALAQRIAAEPAQPGEDANDAYYRQWLAALEDMVARKGAGTRDQLAALQRAWDRAAGRTPHGQPIELRADDFGH